MNFSDEIILAVIALSLLASALTRGAAYLQDRHDSAMARVVGFGARLAAEIVVVLRGLPAGADPQAVKQAMIAAGVVEARTAFTPSIKAVGGTDDKIATIISREVDKVVAGTPVAAKSLGDLREAVVGELVQGVALVAAPGVLAAA